LVVGEGAVDEHGAGEAVEGRVEGQDALDEREYRCGCPWVWRREWVLAMLVEDAKEAVGGDKTAVEGRQCQ
jgi:hypothetical protein